jgi:hypothetical protein
VKLQEIIVYVTVVGLLLFGIVKLLSNKKHSKQGIPTSPAGIVHDVLVTENNKDLITTNISGQVESWQSGDPDILTILDSNSQKLEFQIDPGKTKVSIVRSQNINIDNRLFVISKSLQYMHWLQAFCKGDNVSLLVNKNNNDVEWVMNTGFRACGFKGELL